MLRKDSNKAQRPPTVALLPWGNVLEDFLDMIGISLEVFCNEFRGSWMFGYVDALQRAGTRTVLMCISSRVFTPARFTHRPTGATICVLPVPKIYRRIRRHMLNPYGHSVNHAFGEVRGVRRSLFPLFAAQREVILYLSTPLGMLARALRREGCNVILCQEYEYPRFDSCVLLGKLMRLPVFATFQGGFYQRSHLESVLRPYAMRACSGLIIGANTEIERVRGRYGLPAEKVARIFNPMDLDAWKPIARSQARAVLGIPLDAQVAVWHGRVSIDHKGLDVLLDAWERVCREHPARNLRLLLVGTGQDAEELRRRIEAMRLPGVQWLNEFVHDRAAICCNLSAANVYAFASRREGFPVALLEAMACRLPVVATDAQGVPDILADGEASGGLVVPRNDAPALARALSRLLNDDTLSCELGRRARRRMETSFSLEAVGMQLRAFLSDGHARPGDQTHCSESQAALGQGAIRREIG